MNALHILMIFLFINHTVIKPQPTKKHKTHSVIFANPLHFNHTTVYVQDLKTSTKFYSEVLNLELMSDPFNDQKHSWFNIGPHNQLHVVQGASQKTPHDINIHLAFTVNDLPAFMEELKKKNIQFGDWKGNYGTTIKRPDGVEQIYLQDPDGYWIEINNDRE